MIRLNVLYTTLKVVYFVALLTAPIVLGIDPKISESLSKEVIEVKKSVSKLAPHLSSDRQVKVALAIYDNSEKYNIPKKVLLSIIKIESNFKSTKVSSTGDYSIVQINLKIWNKEFKRLGLPSIDKNRIVKSDNYAISRMCIILNIIKSRHSKDKQWYARYHSNTPEYNLIYQSKINKIMRLMANR